MVACILTGCGSSYHWSKAHPLYRQVPYSTLSITGTSSAFILTRSKWFAKKLEVAPESAQVQLTSFSRQAFLDEMKRAYPALQEIPDTAVLKFPEESQKLDDRIFMKGKLPEQGVTVKAPDGTIPPQILLIHEVIIGTDLKRENFFDYALIHNELEDKRDVKNISAIVSYTLWDNIKQRPLFSAVDEIQHPVIKLTLNDLEQLMRLTVQQIRKNMYTGAGK